MSAARLEDLAKALGFQESAQDILGRLRTVYAQIDQRLAEGAQGLQLPCKAGCDACCHEAVFVCAPEFLAVAEQVMAWPQDRQDRLLHQMLQVASDFEDELELLELVDSGPERDEVARRIRFRCPLLSAEGGCTVYSARELNARTFGQSRHEGFDAPYGCELTHAALKVLPQRPALYGAQQARRALVQALERTERVQVYPWWFARYRSAFEDGPRASRASRPRE